MTQPRFPIFDGEYKPDVEVIDGVPHIFPRRDVIQELAVLEPADDRNDFFASVPVRSVWHPDSGPAVEIGPFSLDDTEIVKLYNAIGKHINTFGSDFRLSGEAS